MLNRLLFVVYVLYCFEVGIFLIIFPWMKLWEQNALLSYYPAARTLFLNGYFRGAVSGLGFSNIVLGVWEIVHFQRYFKKT